MSGLTTVTPLARGDGRLGRHSSVTVARASRPEVGRAWLAFRSEPASTRPPWQAIEVVDVSKAYGGKKLFLEVHTTFSAGRRYGLTGPNGAGKSTFLKIISGELEPDTGAVRRPQRTSVLKQDQFAFESWRAIDVVMMGNARLWAAMSEKHELLGKPNLSDAEGIRLGELESVIAEEDGYTAESDAGELLSGLGIPSRSREGDERAPRWQEAASLAGPGSVRASGRAAPGRAHQQPRHRQHSLARALPVELPRRPHHDLHDRRFLNRICTHIADIDYEAIIVYTGGYDDMVRAKGQVRARIESENSDRSKKIEQLQISSRASAPARALLRFKAARSRSIASRSRT